MPTPAAPTPEEISAAYDGILADGSDQLDALNTAMQHIGHTWLSQLFQHSTCPATLATAVQSVVIAGVVYGLNLGLRIGEAPLVGHNLRRARIGTYAASHQRKPRSKPLFDALIKDGPKHTEELGRVIAPTAEAWLKTFLDGQTVSVPDVAYAAMTYGFNLGLRIGQVRNRSD